jgi:hypothetical protein
MREGDVWRNPSTLLTRAVNGHGGEMKSHSSVPLVF